jgi:hypothetical protein
LASQRRPRRQILCEDIPGRLAGDQAATSLSGQTLVSNHLAREVAESVLSHLGSHLALKAQLAVRHDLVETLIYEGSEL